MIDPGHDLYEVRYLRAAGFYWAVATPGRGVHTILVADGYRSPEDGGTEGHIDVLARAIRTRCAPGGTGTPFTINLATAPSLADGADQI